MHPPSPQVATQFRGEFGERRSWDAGRDRAGVVDNDPYPGYVRRSDLSQAATDQHTFGFMAPCWRLLERAKTHMDQVAI